MDVIGSMGMEKGDKFYYVKRQILREILLAQIASDSGKDFIRYRIPGDRNTIKSAYRAKVRHILKALELIDSIPPSCCGVTYWVKEIPDQNGYRSILCTFCLHPKITGSKRLQLGFHTPFVRASEIYRNYIGKGCMGHWDKKLTNNVCDELMKVLKMYQ